MTILSVVTDVCLAVGLQAPTQVFGSDTRELLELGSIANELAKRIAFDGHDWTLLKTTATLTGDGSSTDFATPTDYRRMIKKACLWPSASPGTPLAHVPDVDQWLGWTVQSFTPGAYGVWTMQGAYISIKPAIANAATVKFTYVSNLIVQPAAGSNKTDFTADTDIFRLDERVLALGMTYEWKKRKGRPYAEDMEDYNDALAARRAEDKGSTMIVIGQPRLPSDVKVAFPGVIAG